jgi:hypothetical protein
MALLIRRKYLGIGKNIYSYFRLVVVEFKII